MVGWWLTATTSTLYGGLGPLSETWSEVRLSNQQKKALSPRQIKLFSVAVLLTVVKKSGLAEVSPLVMRLSVRFSFCSLVFHVGYQLIGSHSGVKLCRWTKVFIGFIPISLLFSATYFLFPFILCICMCTHRVRAHLTGVGFPLHSVGFGNWTQAVSFGSRASTL